MPPKLKFTREAVIAAALDITREGGIQSLTARSLAARLGSSAKPIFGLFRNMEEVQSQVLAAAHGMYLDFQRQDMESGTYPVYKASGMSYIRFAREERELFKLLFMRDRTGEAISADEGELAPLLTLLMARLNISREQAYRFHLENWVYVHGLAAMVASGYLDWDPEFISASLTDIYQGLRHRYTGEGECL